MSTLTTRILGYKVVVRPATQEEIASHRATCQKMGWSTPDSPGYSRAVHAEFVSDTGDVMDLPFELRSTLMTVNPEFVLGMMHNHVEELRERVDYESIMHDMGNHPCHCESCDIMSALMVRAYAPGRKYGA